MEKNKIMDTNIGAKERVTQERLIELFRNVLQYDYLGNWEYREGNGNVEETLLRRYLKRRSYADKEIGKAVAKLKQAAANIGIVYTMPTMRSIRCCVMA